MPKIRWKKIKNPANDRTVLWHLATDGYVHCIIWRVDCPVGNHFWAGRRSRNRGDHHSIIDPT